MARRPLSHPVAVVVFLTAEGADPHDSTNVAEMAIQQALGAATNDHGQLGLDTRAGRRTVHVAQVVELGRAARNGLIVPATSPSAYQR
jgi:hypothetical protein